MSGSYSGGGPSTGGGLPLPSSLPLLVIRNRVLFPGGLLRLSVGKTRSVRLIEDFLISQKRSSQQHQHHSSPLPFHRGGLIAVAALLPEASESRGDGSGGGGGGGGGGRGGGRGDQQQQQKQSPRIASFDDPPVYAVGCAAKVVQVREGRKSRLE
ncbi:hypothetical protein VYU27_006376 [Nannochloropsis oceanica]